MFGKCGLLISAFILLLPWSAAAQDRWPLSVEVNAGLRAGVTSAEHRGSLGLSYSALIALRAHTTDRGGWVGAVSFGGQGPPPHDSGCVAGSDGTCLDYFVEFTAITLMGGWEVRNTGWRVLTGPSVYRIGAATSNLRFAWHGRFDVFSVPIGRISFGGSAQTYFLPSANGNAFLAGSFGVGLRVR